MSKQLGRTEYRAFVVKNNEGIGPLCLQYLQPKPVDHSVDIIALRAAKKAAGEHPAFWRVGSSAVRPFAGDPLPLP